MVTVNSTYCSNLPTIPVVMFSSEEVLLNHWPKLHVQDAPARAVRGRPYKHSFSDMSIVGDPTRLNHKPHFLKRGSSVNMVFVAHLRKVIEAHAKLALQIQHFCLDEKYHTVMNF